MMIKNVLLGLLLIVLPVQDDLQAKIAGWCAQLGHDECKVRDEAVRRLIETGRPALGPVKKLLDSEDAEVKDRAQEVIMGIQASLCRKALHLEVAADRKVYKPGEKITINAKLGNVEDFPVTALKFIYDGGLYPESWISVRLDGKPLRYAGDPLPQVMVHRHMTENRFITINPGDATTVRFVDFSEAWDLGKKDPGLKESYTDSKTAPLKPGKYAVKATYAFKFDTSRLAQIGKDNLPSHHIPGLNWSFEGRSKEMLAEAWQGSLEAETEFEVAP